MPARLILNADDFGLTRGVNRAIAELAAARALTSATLMASGQAFEDAVATAKAHPELGVGCHVVLVDGVPVAPAETVRSLLGSDGMLRPKLRGFLTALMLGRIRREEIVRESVAQIERLQNAGLHVTHVDTHKHTHIFPVVAGAVLEAAERCGVGAIRNPFEPMWSLQLHEGEGVRNAVVKLMARRRERFMAQNAIHSGRVKTTDGTVAIAVTGTMDAQVLRRILDALPQSGTYELCCHPGYNDAELDQVTTRLRAHREVELEALLREIPALCERQDAPQLISFGSL